MDALSRWDIALLLIAGYWAVLALVRLMTSYRDQLVADLRRQLEEEQSRRRAARKTTAPPASRPAGTKRRAA